MIVISNRKYDVTFKLTSIKMRHKNLQSSFYNPKKIWRLIHLILQQGDAKMSSTSSKRKSRKKDVCRKDWNGHITFKMDVSCFISLIVANNNFISYTEISFVAHMVSLVFFSWWTARTKIFAIIWNIHFLPKQLLFTQLIAIRTMLIRVKSKLYLK